MEKYLRLYAEPEIGGLDELPPLSPWKNVVVIPACNEAADFLKSAPPPCDGRSLMILVINQAESAARQVSSNNHSLAEQVQARFELLWRSSSEFGLSLLRDPHSLRDLLLVDRFSQGRQLPAKGGVGHARKIGADLAAKLIHQKHIQSSWIHCTDADVALPTTYFTCCQSVQNKTSEYSALIYPFAHVDGQASDEQDSVEQRGIAMATQLYELSLRYYVAGMRFARSPYAFHTIGSTMAVDASHYAKVRGFPKREAAEDFYLLNKLAKVGTVLEQIEGRECEAIRIAARRSDRVPFGTGAAVGKMITLDHPLTDFLFYQPAVFEALKYWLHCLPFIWQSQSSELNIAVLSGRQDDAAMNFNRQSLLAALLQLKTDQALDHAFRQSKNLNQFSRQMHTWFDAFRTLRLIHILRDHDLPSVNYAVLATSSVFHQFLQQDDELTNFHQTFKNNYLSGIDPGKR